MVIVPTYTYVRSISVPNYLPCLHRPSACDFQSRALGGPVREARLGLGLGLGLESLSSLNCVCSRRNSCPVT